jgi:hypothetical protein
MNHPSDEEGKGCAPGLVRWHANAGDAVRSAQSSTKLILLFQLLGRLDEELCCANARLARGVVFSNTYVSQFINETFEPLWESLRPVPIISVDFRNGHTIKRALQGQVATYICAPDGQVLDILPGVYAPEVYLTQLRSFQQLHAIAALPIDRRQALITKYHFDATSVTTVKKSTLGAALGSSLARIDSSKTTNSQSQLKALLANPGHELNKGPEKIANLNDEETAQWHQLLQDTQSYETVRRAAIHERLGKSAPVRPDGIVKWLYKEVLHFDLDDPYLGFGKSAFGNPFK